MEIVIGFVCMGIAAGLNLVLVLALYRRLDGLPSRVVNLAARERADGERKGMSALQEMAAARVGAIVKSLRQYDEQVAAGFRSQVAEAQARAGERKASEGERPSEDEMTRVLSHAPQTSAKEGAR